MDAEVVVADNASTDDSLGMMAAEFPEVRTLALEENFGFTGGYNRALAQVDAEYYLLLNSDIDVRDGWLQPLVSWMDNHPECGACGPKLHSFIDRDRFEYAGAAGGYLDRYGYPFCRGRVLGKTEPDFGQYDKPKDVLWVSGACLMVRSSLWHDLGGLDERFFAHMEEIDLCWRAALKGYKVTVVPDSVVWHVGGATLPQSSPWKLQLNYRNNLLMLDNNLASTVGRCRARRIMTVRKMLDMMSAMVYLCTGKLQSCKAVMRAHREYRRLRRPHIVMQTCDVKGYLYGLCLLPQAFIRGNRIFTYLREYENRH